MRASWRERCAGVLLAAVSMVSAGDAVVHAWAMFVDKHPSAPLALTEESVLRRRRAGFVPAGYGDYPVHEPYVQGVAAAGARIRHRSSWLNAVSFSGTGDVVSAVRELAFVRAVVPLARHIGSPAPPGEPLPRMLPAMQHDPWYGQSFAQLALVGIPDAHRALRHLRGEPPGTGVLIGFFDSGFLLDHNCFSRVREAIVSDSDFVDNNSDVAHPDTDGSSHGAQTLALVGGYDPGTFMGGAWNARFLLARTEDDAAEYRGEEDNWIAALEWAERLGVSIVNSSLGYRWGFDDAAQNYPFHLMDGSSTQIAIAADSAARRGVLIVNAMGNDGPDTSINTPADSRGVIAAGAVTLDGSLAWFSSQGPTADGRIKPDVVAPGVSIMVPRIGSRSGYVSRSGTSFSAPLIAAVLALMKQGDGAEAVADSLRVRLVRSCRYARGQVSPDNRFGYGIADALFALIGEQLFFCARGSDGSWLPGVTVSHEHHQYGHTDTTGCLVFGLPQHPLPQVIDAGIEPLVLVQSRIDTLPSRLTVKFRSRVTVSVVAAHGAPVGRSDVWWALKNGGEFARISVNDSATVHLPHFSANPVRLKVCAPGYRCSDTLTARPDTGAVMVVVALEPVRYAQPQVFPTVVRLGTDYPRITLQFVADADGERLEVGIRSTGGELVFEHTLFPALDEVVDLSIPCRTVRGERWAPGTYFVILRYRAQTLVRRVLLVG